jgi:hypothetical protein
MKKQFYTIRYFRDGRERSGYTRGRVVRFHTLEEAEAHAAALAAEVLPVCNYDYIALGAGAVREGLSVGRGRRIAEIILRGQEIVSRPGEQ